MQALQNFATDKEHFMARRGRLQKKLTTEASSKTKALTKLQEDWVKQARGVLNNTLIDAFIKQINYVTCKTHDAVLEICLEIEALVGQNPLLYAYHLRNLDRKKLYLTELLQKVKDK